MTVVRTEKYERGFIGKLIKWAFIGFNLLMILWVVGGLSAVSNLETHSAAEKVGASIGATIGITFILMLWGLGDLILGVLVLVSRGNKILIEETVLGLPPASEFAPSVGGDFGQADNLIAKFKAQVETASPKQQSTPIAPPAAAGFGKRRSV
jgi:hypothetical protein